MLHWAVKSGKDEILKLLLQSGANVNKQNDRGETALYYAVEKNRHMTVRLLLEKDEILVDLKTKEKLTALLKACDLGYYEIVVLLLNKGPDVNAKDNEGNGPLFAAANSKHADIVKLLLDQPDILVDQKQWSGWSALYMACVRGSLNIVKHLVNKGANVNSQNDDGDCPLHEVAFNNYLDIAKLLLNLDDIQVDLQENYHGGTPLHSAAGKGHVDMIKLLVEKGKANTNLKNKKGETPLQVAKRKKKYNAVALLRKYDQRGE